MYKSPSAAGARFRLEGDTLFRRYERLLVAIVKHGVSGFTGDGPPSFNFVPTYFETLLQSMPVRYPKPKPLDVADRYESEWRRDVAQAVWMKMNRRVVEATERRDGEATARFARVDQAIWTWALEIERGVNPNWQVRTSQHVMVRRYLADVVAFCEKWRLHADWATWAVIDHHFSRHFFSLEAFFPVVTSSWEGDESFVVKVPGADPLLYARERDAFLYAVMETTIDDGAPVAINVTWTPLQDEQQRYEREHNASCVVVRWEVGRFSRTRRAPIINYVVEECAYRLRRTITKTERRGLLSELDPQIRAAGARLVGRGWNIASDAPLRQHARWLAYRLLTGASWNQVRRDLSPGTPPYARAVQRACIEFARIAGLSLDTQRKRTA